MNILKFIKKREFWDTIGNYIYYILSLFCYLFFEFWFELGKKSDLNPVLSYFIPYNFIYSFNRGIINKNLIVTSNNLTSDIKINNEIIKLISLGDTSKELDDFVYSQIEDNYLLHLGDYCYLNREIPFQNLMNRNKVIFVPGCREVIPYANTKWQEIYQKLVKYNYYHKRIFNSKGVNILDLFIITNYLFPGSKSYYDQIDWLTNSINNSNATFKVICCHNPPYSASRHGNDYIIQSIIRQSEIKDKIDLVLSGHDHTYQHFKIDNLDYVVCGLGGHSKYKFMKDNKNLLKFYNQEYGILKLTLSKNILEIKFKNILNQEIDSFEINSK